MVQFKTRRNLLYTASLCISIFLDMMKLEFGTFWTTYLLSRYCYDYDKPKRKDYFILNDVVFVNDRINPLRVFIHTNPNVK